MIGPLLADRTPHMITFTVYGKPEPKGSTRTFMVGGKPRTTSDNPSLRGWEDAIRFAAQAQAGGVFFGDGPVSLILEFWIQRPRSVKATKRPHMTTRPDLSKLIRGVEDALTAILWKDDAQVTDVTASKQYAGTDEPSRVAITITGIADTLTTPTHPEADHV